MKLPNTQEVEEGCLQGLVPREFEDLGFYTMHVSATSIGEK